MLNSFSLLNNFQNNELVLFYPVIVTVLGFSREPEPVGYVQIYKNEDVLWDLAHRIMEADLLWAS